MLKERIQEVFDFTKSESPYKKAAAEKKALANKKVNPRTQIDSQKKRDSRTELLTVSVSLNTRKIVSIASIGILASAILVSAMVFIAG